MDELKAKKARVEEDVTRLTAEVDRLCEKAEEQGTLTLLSQVNPTQKHRELHVLICGVANALRNGDKDKKYRSRSWERERITGREQNGL